MGARVRDISVAHVLHRRAAAPEEKMAPPRGLSKEARALWKRIVDTYPACHFKPGDDVLLRRYCEAAVTADKESAILETEENVTENGKVNPRWTLVIQLTTTMARIATKLSICPSTRLKRTREGEKGTLEIDVKRNPRAGIMFGS